MGCGRQYRAWVSCAALSITLARAGSGLDVYRQLSAFHLSGASIAASNLAIRKDRVHLTFTGTFYLEDPVAGKVRGAVFVGRGTFLADPPPVPFERDNLRRMLNADRVESDFTHAVLRFSDGTDAEFGTAITQTAVPAGAQKVADRFAPRVLKQLGANVCARLATSILNGESPGFFFAAFGGGRLGHFSYVLDFEDRLPTASFVLDAGECGVIFAPGKVPDSIDVWMAFRPRQDYNPPRITYSDTFDQLAVRHYDMDIDTGAVYKNKLTLEARMEIEPLTSGLRAVSFLMNDELSSADGERRKCAMRVRYVKSGSVELSFAQEDWDTGFTVFFPSALVPGRSFILTVGADGDAMRNVWPWPFVFDDQFSPWSLPDESRGYARIGGWPSALRSWYPRYRRRARSTFRMNFLSGPADLIVGAGTRTESSQGNAKITRYSLDKPSAYMTFDVALAYHPAMPLQVYRRQDPQGVTIETYYSTGWNGAPFPPVADRNDMADELTDTLHYLTQLFGPFPQKTMRGICRPGAHPPGPSSLLLMCGAVGGFHEAAGFESAHQWWGDLVGARTYRDQWLLTGLAGYASELFAAVRREAGSGKDLIHVMRLNLRAPSLGGHGNEKSTLAEIGPIAEGRRLTTRETTNGQVTLADKSALVIRMLDFLLTDPETGDDQAFFQMLTDFACRYQWRDVTTEEFRDFASPYFARSPIGLQMKLRDLNWFFDQWVQESYFPSYRMEYQIDNSPGGGVLLHGTIEQRHAGNGWAMPLPVIVRIRKHKPETKVVLVRGEKTEFAWKFASRPSSVRLDPDRWILSASTTAVAAH